MNPDLITFVVGLACLLIGIFGTDWAVHRPARQAHADTLTRRTTERDDARAKLAKERAANTALTRLLARAVRGQAEVALDAEWLAICLATTEAERDTYRTAFEAVMMREVRLDLVRPDEPVESATVVEFPKRGTR